MKSESVSSYRWVILLVYSLLQSVMQMCWITWAPITGEAATYFGVTPLRIGLLSMIFMMVYLFVSIPASWAVDNWGIRKGVGVGAVMLGVFGLMRGLSGTSYTMVLIATIMLAVAQPFILNSITLVAARWFPLEERATAAGIAVLFQYVGVVIAMMLSPWLTIHYGIAGMLNVFGILCVISAVIFFVCMREAPETGVVDDVERTAVFEGIKHIFTQRDMILLLVMLFIGLGMFNAVTTWVEQIVAPRGFDSTHAGIVGAALMVGGVIGAVIMPILSDKYARRKEFLIICLAGALPGLVGLSFANGYALLLVSSFILGFFFMSAAPIAFQYGTELSYPAPEATSQGMLVLAGQVSGILFIYGMDFFRSDSGSMTPFLVFFIFLLVVDVVLAAMMHESSMMEAELEEKHEEQQAEADLAHHAV